MLPTTTVQSCWPGPASYQVARAMMAKRRLGPLLGRTESTGMVLHPVSRSRAFFDVVGALGFTTCIPLPKYTYDLYNRRPTT